MLQLDLSDFVSQHCNFSFVVLVNHQLADLGLQLLKLLLFLLEVLFTFKAWSVLRLKHKNCAFLVCFFKNFID